MAVSRTLHASVDYMTPGAGQFYGDLKIGHAAEGYVADILSDGTYVEVKRDARSTSTGNLFVEYQHRPYGEWKPSGVMTSKSDFFAFVMGQLILLVPTAFLRSLAEEAIANGRTAPCTDSDCPTQGALVPVRTVLERMRPSG